MPALAARLRYPYGRVLLGRTKLAYIHLRNLLTDAKRDRTARVAGYVAIWLPEEFLILFLREGEVVNAIRATAHGNEPIAISSALGRVPAEPEFGEIAFYEAPVELLVCMYHTFLVPSDPWPGGFSAGDARVLFPHLRGERFTGVVEVVNRDAANYLVLQDGLIERTFVVDDNGSGRTEQLARVFGPASTRPNALVAAWRGPLHMPTQAPAALVAAYRELIRRMYLELGSYGVPVPSAVGERVRDALVRQYPALSRFAAGPGSEDPSEDGQEVTAGLAAWVTETVREALDGDEEAARRVVAEAARERRHMLHAAGFLSALPWELEW
ncbi:MAG TPA: hypothetical protein VFW03_11100 [Gemmatimonadaceae bacterium]|nr:hypothetical protein [Gemmatimonadaceae bacterium]